MQQIFVNICVNKSSVKMLLKKPTVTGVRGIKFLYDSFFKEIMNPETASERLEEFHEFPNEYIHHANPKFNTRLKLNLLQDYVMIPLDIYKQIYHNKVKNKCTQPFDNKLEAWLARLSRDDPEVVVQLITKYSEFKAMYEEAYRMCLNTVQLMIDEMQDEINAQAKELEAKDKELEDKDKKLQGIISVIYAETQGVNKVTQLPRTDIMRLFLES